MAPLIMPPLASSVLKREAAGAQNTGPSGQQQRPYPHPPHPLPRSQLRRPLPGRQEAPVRLLPSELYLGSAAKNDLITVSTAN